MARDLDVTLLRAFLAVVDTGSVTGAAKLLNRTQAAVSQQLKRLEDALATILFDRTGRTLALTPAGEQLLGQARRLVALNDEVYGMMTTPSFDGEVRLGIPMDVVPTYAPTILKRFALAWPQVRVQLMSGNTVQLLAALKTGDLDITLTTEFALKGKGGSTLRRDQLVWVAAPGSDVYARDPLPISIGSPECVFRPVVLDALRGMGREWRFVFEVYNQEAINATVAAGLAVCAMLKDSVPPDLRVLGPEAGLPPLPACGINMYLPAGGGSELGEEMARHIRAEFDLRFGPPVTPIASMPASAPVALDAEAAE